MRSTIAVDEEISILLFAQLKGGNAINTHIKKTTSEHFSSSRDNFRISPHFAALSCVVCCLFEKCSWIFHTSSSMLAEFCLGRAWWWRRRRSIDMMVIVARCRAASWKSCEQALHRSAVKCFEKKNEHKKKKTKANIRIAKVVKAARERKRSNYIPTLRSALAKCCVNVCLYLAVKLRDSRRLYLEVSATTFSRTPNITN